jgi:hypothetical protein
MSFLVLEDRWSKLVAKWKCNNPYKSASGANGTLFLGGAFESLALKNTYRFPLYRDNARSSEFTQCGRYGFPMKAQVFGQLFMSHTSHYSVLRFL